MGKVNHTYNLARAFVEEFLPGEPFDSRAHGRVMRDAKRFVNPGNDDPPVPPEDVLGCLRAMKSGLFGFEGEIESIWQVTWGTPTYLQQYYEWKKTPPPFYDVPQVKLWEQLNGCQAYPSEPDSVIMTAPSIPTF